MPPKVLRCSCKLTRASAGRHRPLAPPFGDPFSHSGVRCCSSATATTSSDSGKEILGEDRRADHGEAIVADRDGQHADQSAQDMELPLLEGGGAEKAAAEGSQHESVARRHLSRAEVGGHERAPDSGAGARAWRRRRCGCDRPRCRRVARFSALTPIALMCWPWTVRFRSNPKNDEHGRHDQHEMRHAPEPADGDVGEFAASG